ncbi:MAG TPA: hypothetical protein VJ623_10895 [Holophagaceae bacterium]|nr:hypothetical protein [Holophagaceae bacterium]
MGASGPLAGMPGDAFQFGGHTYCTGYQITGGAKDQMTTRLWIRDSQGWRLLASLVVPRRKGAALIQPLHNGRFLAIAKGNLDPEVAPGQGSPFSILTLDEKDQLQFGTALDPEVPKLESLPELKFLLPLGLVIRTPDHLTLIVQKTGMYWVFSLENGSLQRSGRLYASLTDEMLQQGLPWPVVLHAQPLPDGDLFLSTRSEAALLGSRQGLADLKRIEMETGKASLQDQHRWVEAWKSKRTELNNQFPEVVWWRFSPNSGTFTRLNPPPPGARETLAGLSDEAVFHWIPTPTGQVRITASDFTAFPLQEPPLPSKSRAEGAKAVKRSN